MLLQICDCNRRSKILNDHLSLHTYDERFDFHCDLRVYFYILFILNRMIEKKNEKSYEIFVKLRLR